MKPESQNEEVSFSLVPDTMKTFPSNPQPSPEIKQKRFPYRLIGGLFLLAIALYVGVRVLEYNTYVTAPAPIETDPETATPPPLKTLEGVIVMVDAEQGLFGIADPGEPIYVIRITEDTQFEESGVSTDLSGLAVNGEALVVGEEVEDTTQGITFIAKTIEILK